MYQMKTMKNSYFFKDRAALDLYLHKYFFPHCQLTKTNAGFEYLQLSGLAVAVITQHELLTTTQIRRPPHVDTASSES